MGRLISLSQELIIGRREKNGMRNEEGLRLTLPSAGGDSGSKSDRMEFRSFNGVKHHNASAQYNRENRKR